MSLRPMPPAVLRVTTMPVAMVALVARARAARTARRPPINRVGRSRLAWVPMLGLVRAPVAAPGLVQAPASAPVLELVQEPVQELVQQPVRAPVLELVQAPASEPVLGIGQVLGPELAQVKVPLSRMLAAAAEVRPVLPVPTVTTVLPAVRVVPMALPVEAGVQGADRATP
jgi:hypothetical protein